MAKFKVIALSVGGLGNKVFKAGDLVTEKNFPDGNAEALVKSGFLTPIDEKSEAEQRSEDGAAEKPLDRMNKEELLKLAAEKGKTEEETKDLTKKQLIELLSK